MIQVNVSQRGAADSFLHILSSSVVLRGSRGSLQGRHKPGSFGGSSWGRMRESPGVLLMYHLKTSESGRNTDLYQHRRAWQCLVKKVFVGQGARGQPAIPVPGSVPRAAFGPERGSHRLNCCGLLKTLAHRLNYVESVSARGVSTCSDDSVPCFRRAKTPVSGPSFSCLFLLFWHFCTETALEICRKPVMRNLHLKRTYLSNISEISPQHWPSKN